MFRKNLTYKTYILLFLFVVMLILSFLIINQALKPAFADATFLDNAKNNPEATIEFNLDEIIITPKDFVKDQGIIFYPGGLVTAEAYIYKLVELAIKSKSKIYIATFPLNLAVLNLNKANEIRSKFPNITKWYLVGHSLGGAMACRHLHDNKTNYKGIILWGAYCDIDISKYTGNVIQIIGEEDGLISWDTVESSKTNLPKQKILLKSKGLNHAQAGNYGKQNGDKESTISDLKAMEILVNSTHIGIN